MFGMEGNYAHFSVQFRNSNATSRRFIDLLHIEHPAVGANGERD